MTFKKKVFVNKIFLKEIFGKIAILDNNKKYLNIICLDYYGYKRKKDRK